MDDRYNDINRCENNHTKIQIPNKQSGKNPIIGFGIERIETQNYWSNKMHDTTNVNPFNTTSAIRNLLSKEIK